MNKPKKGRPTSENPMVHTAVVLPRELVRRLKKDGEVSGRGLSGEIRQRLQLSHDKEGLPSDPVTSDLLGLIQKLADGVADAMGKKWHEGPNALTAFKVGVAEYLAQYHPKGDVSAPPGGHDDPGPVGRTLAKLYWNARKKEG
jgi:hypothetical protein